MTHFNNQTPVIHSFGVVPPLSTAEAERLFRFAWEKGIGLALKPGMENGRPVTFLIVLYGDWRMVEEELERLGREFYEPTSLDKYSPPGETI